MTNGQSLQKMINEYRAAIRTGHRYASFDYCFAYFRAFRSRGQTAAIASPLHLRRSCLELGLRRGLCVHSFSRLTTMLDTLGYAKVVEQ